MIKNFALGLFGFTGYFAALELKDVNEVLQFIVLLLTIIGLFLGIHFKIKRNGRKHNSKDKDI